MSLFSSIDEYHSSPFAPKNSTNFKRGYINKTKLEPENEYGNVEYKLRLTHPTPQRIERLVTQLNWRIREGHGEAILYLGVKDNGHFVGLNAEDLELSLKTLEQMTCKISARMFVVNEKVVEEQVDDPSAFGNQVSKKFSKRLNKNFTLAKDTTRTVKIDKNSENIVKNLQQRNLRKHHPRKVLQILIKRKTHEISEELRVAVLGPTESGKSTLLGVLSHGENDNGRGSARLNLFRHRHEIKSGHTSSISQEIFGIDQNGDPVTYNTCITTEEIIESSTKIVTLIDLAGHQRYLNTTLFGLNSHSPDIVLLVVNCATQITTTFSDHMLLAFGMEKSVVVVINKIDIVSIEDRENCYLEVVKLLQLLNLDKIPLRINTISEAIDAASRLSLNIVPIFFTSCVTGAGLRLLYKFFEQTTPSLSSTALNSAMNDSSEMQVDETFELANTGTVVGGLVARGVIREGDQMLFGPDDDGMFSSITIASLQRHKIPCNFVRAGQKCTLAFASNNGIRARRGMVIKEFDPYWSQNFPVCWKFEAKIKLINPSRDKLSVGNSVSVYVGNVKQTCNILSISNSSNSPSELILLLRFIKRPEFIREANRVILRYALSKGIGFVLRIYTMKSQN